MTAPQTRQEKPFSFSYSRIKNFETCPRRYQQIDVLKNFREDESEALTWGNELHAALEARIAKGRELPITMRRYEKHAADLDAQQDAIPGLTIRTELKLSFDRQFQATGYYDNATWFRAKVDVLALAGSKAVAIDWKTGRVLDDHAQLALAAQCVFSNYPEVMQVSSIYMWLGDDARTEDIYTRDGMVKVWNNIWPRITALEEAHAAQVFPPKPSGLCRNYCPVSSCEFHGKGSR
jgi:RecB family exonuclease